MSKQNLSFELLALRNLENEDELEACKRLSHREAKMLEEAAIEKRIAEEPLESIDASCGWRRTPNPYVSSV